MRTIDSEWERFANAVIPVTAGEVQRLEMRKAFYAGASVMISMIGDVSAEHSETAAVAIIQGLHEEAKAFARSMATVARAQQ